MNRVLIALDSFKGSLGSVEAGNAVAEGLKRVYPDCRCVVRPLADGGEGTVDALVFGMGGRREHVTVTGPLGLPVVCGYGIVGDLAVMEMAAAAGLTLVPEPERDPMHTTTCGVGELIRDAVGKGCRRFLVGIGGSATNDGGAGMLQALGFGLLDASGAAIAPGAEGLRELARITDTDVIPELSGLSFRIACDVTNPLCGPNGCSAVFGPQKGASPEAIPRMDRWLGRYAELAKGLRPDADPDAPGSGAAGGLGFAFRTFTPAVLEPGVRIVLEETHLEEEIRRADLVITGEGRLDRQTVMGKAPGGVALLAKKYGKRVIAFSGCASSDAAECNGAGIDAFFPIPREALSLREAMESATAKRNLTDTAEQVFRLIRTCEG